MSLISPKVLTIAFAMIFACGVVSYSQEPTDVKQYSDPVRWTKYRIASQKLSFRFPKLPVAREVSDRCTETDSGRYYAYAGGVVYEFEWHAKSRDPIPNWCETPTKFSKTAFTNRLDELKAEKWLPDKVEKTVAGVSAKVFRLTSGSVLRTRWLIWEKDRWLELGVTHHKDMVVDEAKFSARLKLSSSTGLDVESGAEATFGDADVDLKSNFEGKIQEGLFIIAKPRPGYTDEARYANLQ